MQNQFIVNIIHRPEMVPEYAEKITGHGQSEDLGRKALLTESLDIFKIQQAAAHKNGLKTTIQMTYASLFNDEAVALAKHDHEVYGDEIATTLLGLPCEEFRKKYQTKDFCIWMFDIEMKQAVVDDVFGKFFERFGFYPESTGAYYMDAALTNYIKEKYPMVKCAVATCWEEGPKAYHTCNNSWYTLMDGGPWAPWIPSKVNTHAPAANEEEDSGIVAIPHLSRDLMACYDGNGSNFGTHPQNVLRGMVYTPGQFDENGIYGGQSYPYLYNLIDQYRYQAKFNGGYAYNMMFVGPGWMNKMGRWEAPYELLKASYEDGCAYYGKLKKQGKLIDMTMREFADFYRAGHSYTTPECALWRDIVYGSNKQLFWYCDPYMRVCVNMDQGGAIVDLRPYAAKLEWEIGIGTPHVQECAYPFLIQEKYRAGYFTHYAGEGTIRSAKLRHNGEEVDLALCRTHAHFSEVDIGNGKKARKLALDPVKVEFYDCTVTLETVITFTEGSSDIRIDRSILEMSDSSAIVEIDEYMTACYGTTEYPEDMTCVRLYANKGSESNELAYAYKCRECSVTGADSVEAVVPPIKTKVSFTAQGRDLNGYYKEGYAFSPMFTLGYKGIIKEKEAFTTWLKLAREG